MDMPEIGARIRSGSVATVIRIDPPNAVGNVRCIVQDDHERLGWIMYYASGTRSNINYFREDQVEAIRASLVATTENELRQGGRMIRLVRAHASDAVALTAISQRAFDNDVNYGAPGPGGPPGYDSADWQRRTIAGSEYYCILEDETLIGGVIISGGAGGAHELWRLFLEPERQNQGIGSQVLSLVYAQYPLVTRWRLDTPNWNERTRRFYARNGFTEVGEAHDGSVLFERRSRPPRPVL